MLKVTRDQEELFRDQGYLYLPGALSKKTVQPVKAHALKELRKQKIWAQGKLLSSRLKKLPPFQQVSRLGQLVVYPSLRDQLITKPLHATVRRLCGSPLTSAQEAKLLISLPDQGNWTFEGLGWHRDISKSSMGQVPGIQAFFLLDNLSSHGGGTLALARSHRLNGPSRSKQNIEGLLRNSPPSKIVVEGVELSILEMSGEMGDVYLMDMRLLHTPSVNATSNVRLMATARFFAV